VDIKALIDKYGTPSTFLSAQNRDADKKSKENVCFRMSRHKYEGKIFYAIAPRVPFFLYRGRKR